MFADEFKQLLVDADDLRAMMRAQAVRNWEAAQEYSTLSARSRAAIERSRVLLGRGASPPANPTGAPNRQAAANLARRPA